MPMLRGSARVTKDLSIGKKAKYVLLIMRPWNKKFFSSHVLNISVDIEGFCFCFCFFLVFRFVSLIWIFQPEIFAADESEIDRCSSISKESHLCLL